MKKIKEMLRRIGTAGLAAIMLTAQMPVTAFAEEIAQPQEIVVSDEVLPTKVQTDDVLPGESGGGIIEGAASEKSGEDIANMSKTGDEAVRAGETPLTEKDASEKTANEESSDPVEKQEEGVDAQEAQESDKKDADGDKEKEEQTASEEEENLAFSESKSIDGVRITVEAEEGVFSEGATLSVEKVTQAQEKQAEEAVEEKRPDEQNVAVSYTYDIKVLDKDGNEIQPADQGKVKVSFVMEEVADSNLDTNVYHITEKEDATHVRAGAMAALTPTEFTAEKLPVETDGDTAIAETDGFSLYTVEFTYNNLEYLLPGDTSVPMSEILTTLGLTGEVTAMEISDTSLFSASNETSEWIVTAHQAFDTTEWMKVTINGVVYEIRVTDDASGLAAIDYLYYKDEAAAIAGNTTTGSCTDYTVVSDQTAWGAAGQKKWYVVNSSVTIDERITVSGDVHLILSNGCTLTASKGIGVTNGNSLTIYGQSANESTMGAIDAQLGIQNVYNYLAAIGGGGSQNSSGQITINGGKITAKGGTNAAGIGGGKEESGNVTINGGFITAISQYNNATPGAAIGGGSNGSGTVTINGGHVVATGGQSSAGIGSGYAASATVTINSGIIEAHGGAGAAGIGSGKYWNDTSTTRQATVYIHGGTVTADTKSPMYNTDGSAAIGGGAHSQGFVAIDGGHVTATAPKNCTCIGNYEVNYRQTGSVTITGGVVMARLDSSVQASDTYYGIGGADCSVTLGWTNESDSITAPAWGKQGNNIATQNNGVTFVDDKSFQYQDTHTLAEAASLRNSATLIPFIPAAQENVEQADVSGVRAWYPYTGSAIEPEPVVTYAGTALTKGTDYTLSYTSDHTSVGKKTVTITGKGSYTGAKIIPYEIVAASTTYLDDTGTQKTCTAFQCLDQSDTTLGAGWYLVYDNLTIDVRISLTGDVKLILKDGTTLTAQKGISVPSSASLTIYAQSNSESTAGKLETGAPDVSYPGIGGPYQANTAVTPGNITVVGGVINASGGVGAAAIGGASYSPGGNITIKGGFVTAGASVGGGAAIGGGANADGGTITISDGKVIATGNGGAAIGGGSGGKSGTINISGGTVTATASGGAAIGGGSNGAGETINITGGTITATNSGETGGAGIGGGINAAGGSITIQNAAIAKATANAGAGIGSGGGETAGTTTVIIGTGATVTNAGSYNGAGIGSGQNSSAACSVTIKDGANVTSKSTIGAGIGGGAGASNFSVTIQDNNTTVNAWAGGIGIQDGNGNLSAYGGAAIGGGANVNGGTVNIEGGTVTAKAIGGGAGIGSGANTSTSATTDSGSITISGGNVTATATHRAAGIGGGRRSNGGTITINGGTITANGSDAAGIGHGGEDTLWEGQGSFHIPIIDDPTQDVGGAWYDSIVPIAGTNKATTDGTVTFTYTDTVSITASSYPAAVTLGKEFMYSDTGEKVNDSSITAEKTLVPYSNHVHSFTYSAEGATLTATCNASGCILVDHKATLTVNAPSDLTYDGTEKAATVTGEIPGVTTPGIVYKQGETTLDAAPVNAGTYTASITLESATASVTANITQRTITVTAADQSVELNGEIVTGTDKVSVTSGSLVDGHSITSVTLTPSSTANVTTSGTITPSGVVIKDASGNNVTANYNITYTAGTLTVTKVKAKVTTAPTANNRTYDGTAADLLTGGIANTSLEYSTDGTSYSPTVPQGTNANTYTVYYRAAANENYDAGDAVEMTVTISKANSFAASVTANNRTYDGTDKPLVTVTGETKGGEMKYYSARVDDPANPPTEPTDESAYTTSIPTATDAGTYYVWYKVIGDANHIDVAAAGPLTIVIEKADFANKTVSANTKYGLSGTIELKDHIAPGGIVGELSVADTNGVLEGAPVLTGTVLSYSFKNEAENVGKAATVTIPVTNAANYNDYSITVTLNVINCEHSHTKLINVREATCTDTGYTGDTYCTDCNSVIATGNIIPINPDNHAYDSGVITKQPSIFAEGIRTYTCNRCHHTYTETIPKIDDGEDHSDLIEDVTDDDGNTKAEVNTKDKEDGSKETTVTVGGQEVEKIVTDANGNETVETSIWIGGLRASYTYTGSAIKPSFHVYDGTKKLTSGKDYSVSYKSNKNAGATATITISFKGNYKGTAQEKLSFAITPAVLGEDVIAADVATYATGKALKPVPTMKWASTGKSINKKNFAFAYKDAAGNDITGIKEAGQYKVVITSKNGSFTGETEAAITVTGSKKLLLSGATVKLSPNKYTYTGDPITPAVGSYTLKLNGKTLTEGTDYYVSDIRNNTNPGKATIVFAAKESNQAGYVGEKSATFTISKGRALKDGDGFTYSYAESVPYAKGGAKPTVVVKDGDDTLKAGTDYTISYSKNTKVTNGATAVITIKGKGNYKGSVKKYFTVTKQDISKLAGNIITADKVESKKGYKNPTVTITDLDGKKLKAGTDFAIVSDSYSGPDKNGVVTATVSGKGNYTGTVIITYRYIKGTQQLSKVKAMKSLAGKTYTGREVRLTNADLTGILYTGSKNSPVYLIPGTDFKVIGYANNTKTGTAKVTIQGIGAYGGTRTLSFKIIAKKGDYKGSLVGGEWTKVQ